MEQLELVRRSNVIVDEKVERTQEQLRELTSRRQSKDVGRTTAPSFMPFGEGPAPAELEGFAPRFTAEAIVLSEMRPAWLVQNDEIHILGEYDELALVEENRDTLERQSKRVGRIDLFNHRSLNYAGSGWLIEKDIVCTNRHVAEVFARANWAGQWDFAADRFGDPMRTELSFLRQHSTLERAERRAFITEVLFVSDRNELDIAFVKVVLAEQAEPMQPYTKKLEDELPCAVVGYPAWDGHRNDRVLMDQIFGGIYDVKRFAPGRAFKDNDNDGVITADYSSLGGNSGSAVVDLASGKVLGLHFAGAFREANYAVSADMVWAALAAQRTFVAARGAAPAETPTTPTATLEGRGGYEEEFLGTGRLALAMPGPGAHLDDVAKINGDEDNVLRYEHFSVVQNAKRRLPLFTAVNIDGSQARQLKREGTWRLDPRLRSEDQIGNELYRRNPLDRGHLVRRMDPGWGEESVAKRAERDTFHYTNCAPQHEDLNQKAWLGLEDFILGSAKMLGFKASIFTGPVFRDDDPELHDREGVPIPKEFWKIAVMINSDTGNLSASGYALSQGRMLRGIIKAEFIYGQYRTYQLPIATIAEETGLALNHFVAIDSLMRIAEEGADGSMMGIVNGPGDMIL